MCIAHRSFLPLRTISNGLFLYIRQRFAYPPPQKKMFILDSVRAVNSPSPLFKLFLIFMDINERFNSSLPLYSFFRSNHVQL